MGLYALIGTAVLGAFFRAGPQKLLGAKLTDHQQIAAEFEQRLQDDQITVASPTLATIDLHQGPAPDRVIIFYIRGK